MSIREERGNLQKMSAEHSNHKLSAMGSEEEAHAAKQPSV